MPGIHHLDPQARGRRRRTPISTPPWRRVADRVGQQVHQRRGRACRRSVRTTAVVGTRRSSSPLRSARGANSATSRAQQRAERHVRDLRRHDAGVELGDVEQRAEQSVDRLERQLDVLDQTLGALRQLGLGQGGQEQPGGVERLQQIVRGRGEEAGLGEVGGIGRGPRLLDRPVGPLELGHGLLDLRRPLADLRLEQGRPLEQRELRALQVHAALDPADQHVADLAQLGILARELGEPAVELIGHGAGLAADRDAGKGLIDVHRAPLLAEAGRSR